MDTWKEYLSAGKAAMIDQERKPDPVGSDLEPIGGNEEEGCEAENDSEDDSEDEISSVQATTQWKDRTKSSLQKRTADVLADADNGLPLPEMLFEETQRGTGRTVGQDSEEVKMGAGFEIDSS